MTRTRVAALISVIAAGIVIAPLHAQTVAKQRVIIHAGMLLAVPGEKPQSIQSLLIEGERITALRSGFVNAEDVGWDAGTVQIIDLRERFVMPGMVDLHVHLTTSVDPGGDLRVVKHSAADLALTAAAYARLTLLAGFTTVLDIGTGRRIHDEALFALRDAIAAGKIEGPRLLVVGSPISATGSARTGLYRADVEAVVGPDGECDGADDCRRAVREQIKRGADAINVYVTGSLNDAFIAPQAMTNEEIRAVVDTAHSLGRIVVADGHNAPGLNAALRAGADVLITATWPDETTWRLLKDTGVAIAFPIYAFEFVARSMRATSAEGQVNRTPMPMDPRILEISSMPYVTDLAFKRGVPLAIGSDTGVIPHGDNAQDLVEFVKRGMPPAQAIRAGTVNGAEALHLSNEIGTLEEGKFADVIAVSGNPLEDISELRRVNFVMARGTVHKQN